MRERQTITGHQTMTAGLDWFMEERKSVEEWKGGHEVHRLIGQSLSEDVGSAKVSRSLIHVADEDYAGLGPGKGNKAILRRQERGMTVEEDGDRGLVGHSLTARNGESMMSQILHSVGCSNAVNKIWETLRMGEGTANETLFVAESFDAEEVGDFLRAAIGPPTVAVNVGRQSDGL